MKKPLAVDDFKNVDVEKLSKGANFLFGANAPHFGPPGSLFDVNSVEQQGMPPEMAIKPPKEPTRKVIKK